MTDEQINDLLAQLTRIADALEAAVPTPRRPDISQIRYEQELERVVKNVINAEKIKVPQK